MPGQTQYSGELFEQPDEVIDRGSLHGPQVPQDRAGRFSTELFERYQRSERAVVAALAEM